MNLFMKKVIIRNINLIKKKVIKIILIINISYTYLIGRIMFCFKLSPRPNESIKIELKDIIFQYFQKCPLLILRKKN